MYGYFDATGIPMNSIKLPQSLLANITNAARAFQGLIQIFLPQRLATLLQNSSKELTTSSLAHGKGRGSAKASVFSKKGTLFASTCIWRWCCFNVHWHESEWVSVKIVLKLMTSLHNISTRFRHNSNIEQIILIKYSTSLRSSFFFCNRHWPWWSRDGSDIVESIRRNMWPRNRAVADHCGRGHCELYAIKTRLRFVWPAERKYFGNGRLRLWDGGLCPNLEAGDLFWYVADRAFDWASVSQALNDIG